MRILTYLLIAVITALGGMACVAIAEEVEQQKKAPLTAAAAPAQATAGVPATCFPKPIQTVPTGFSGEPPSGPATPVNASA